jgi:oligo-alginate lyase
MIMKYKSTFFRAATLEKMRRNAEKSPLKASVLQNAEQWNRLSLDDLWGAVFGPEPQRSHMVLSYGWCPSCKQITDKYGWVLDPFARDWKLTCPACHESFPKNDFGAFYRSGLDPHGVFRQALADRSLLFNTNAPDPADPKHMFGVDDGTGYREGKDRWMFVGTYLLQSWERYFYAGILSLARAFILTGDMSYARRCGVLLDRVSDLWPDFDFFEQGVMYEEERTSR